MNEKRDVETAPVDSLVSKNWISIKDNPPEEGCYRAYSGETGEITANFGFFGKAPIWQVYIPGTPLLFQPEISGITHYQKRTRPTMPKAC